MMLIWLSFQKRGHGSRRDRDTTLLLLLHPVSRRSAVVGLTDLVVDTGVEQDTLGRRRLAGIDVRHDADVADLLEVGKHFLCHSSLFSSSCPVRPPLPAVVSEGRLDSAILMGVLATLDRGTETVRGVEDLVHETLGHRVLAALPRVVNEPAQRESRANDRLNLDGHLVGRTADAAGPHLERRPDVVDRALENRRWRPDRSSRQHPERAP